MTSRSRARIDPGHVLAWFLGGGLLGYGAVSFLGFGIFIVPIGLVLAAWFVARHPEDTELVVLALLFGGSVTFTVVALAGDGVGSHGLDRGVTVAVASGAGFALDLVIRARRGGDDA